nr:hypothetical protein [Vibrio splendidus]MCC4881484.1 hypothetical protein [Vibrio splendidus]
MRKSDIYRLIDESEPKLRYRIAKEIKAERANLSSVVDAAMEVHIESDLESKDIELKSLAWMERIRITNNTRSQNVASELLKSKVISLSKEPNNGGWIVYIKESRGSVIYVPFDNKFKTSDKKTISISEFISITNPLRSLFCGGKLNSKASTKRILKAIQDSKKHEHGIECNN